MKVEEKKDVPVVKNVLLGAKRLNHEIKPLVSSDNRKPYLLQQISKELKDKEERTSSDQHFNALKR